MPKSKKPKPTRELSHIEQKCIDHIRAKARNLRGLQYAQARQALREVANELSRLDHAPH